jgi:7-cyano-7-deazaguanine synthase in queuosine biosynthesis
MNRTEELRQQVIEQLEVDIADFKKYGGDEFGSDSVMVDIITARRTVELLKKLEAPVEAKWHYYTNDEGKARWKCTNCGKIIRRGAHEKLYCSRCGARLQPES